MLSQSSDSKNKKTNESVITWNAFFRLLKIQLEKEIKQFDLLKPAELADIRVTIQIFTLFLVYQTLLNTQTIYTSYSKEEPNESLDPLSLFIVQLALYVAVTEHLPSVRINNLAAREDFMRSMLDIVMRYMEAIEAEMPINPARISKTTDAFLQFCDDIREEFSKYQWKISDDSQKGDWGWEAGKKMLYALCGHAKKHALRVTLLEHQFFLGLKRITEYTKLFNIDPSLSDAKQDMRNDITVYIPDAHLAEPDEPLKPSTPLHILSKYIGEENAKEVKAGKALVENPWTGRTYEDDLIYYQSVNNKS